MFYQTQKVPVAVVTTFKQASLCSTILLNFWCFVISDPPKDDGGARITKYIVEIDDGNGKILCSVICCKTLTVWWGFNLVLSLLMCEKPFNLWNTKPCINTLLIMFTDKTYKHLCTDFSKGSNKESWTNFLDRNLKLKMIYLVYLTQTLTNDFDTNIKSDFLILLHLKEKVINSYILSLTLMLSVLCFCCSDLSV